MYNVYVHVLVLTNLNLVYCLMYLYAPVLLQTNLHLVYCIMYMFMYWY